MANSENPTENVDVISNEAEAGADQECGKTLTDVRMEILESMRSANAQHSRGVKWLRIGFIVVFSCIFAVAEVWEWDSNGYPTMASVVGIVSALLIASAATYLTWTDGNSFDELNTALSATKAAELEIEEITENFYEVVEDNEKLVRRAEDWTKRDQLRDRERRVAELLYEGLEQNAATILNGTRPFEEVIQELLDTPGRVLPQAFDFGIVEHWTVCIYKAERPDDDGESVLRCIAHMRSVDGVLENARTWRSGVGVAGTCFAQNKPKFVDDMRRPEFREAYQAAEDDRRPNDENNFVSIGASPIRAVTTKPYGVVVATSSRPNVFRQAAVDFGPNDAVRGLARWVGLAVAMAERGGSPVPHLALTGVKPNGNSVDEHEADEL